MADRKTIASQDPVAKAKYLEQLRMAGRPTVMRKAAGEPNVQPSLWMRVMASVHSLIDPLVQTAQRATAGRIYDPNDYGNVASGYGGRERADVIDQSVSDMQTGKKRPVK